MAQQNEESFRVIDRRLFTPEGDLRDEAREQIEQQEKAEASRPADAGERQPAAGANQAEAAKSPPQVPNPEAPRRSPAFELLIDLVARNAVAYMGGMTDPRTGRPMVDLEAAREIVDMLDALREKTRGNLSPEEDHLLLDVIGSLKMSYLEMSKAAAAAVMRERGQEKV